MKKLVYLWALALVFAACGTPASEGGEDAGSDTDSTAAAQMDELEQDSDEAENAEGEEMLAEHVCSDKCTPEACHFAHGEKGHECSEDCKAMMDGEGHDHDGEGHDHDGEAEG